MRLVFDTETSDLLKPGVPSDDPSQPNMVQLGATLFDGKWAKVASFVSLIKPEGWSMAPEAEAHHGISESRCAKFGVPVQVALLALRSFTTNAMQIIGHNVNFDRSVISAELARLGADAQWWKKKASAFVCSMEISTPILGLKGQFGPKFPSLEEAHRHFYPDVPYHTAHEAEADLLATAKVAQALEKAGKLPLPSLARPPALDTSWRKP